MNRKAKKVWDHYFGPDVEKVMDALGVTIAKAAYGDEHSRYGWDIDHIRPKSKGGTNDMWNLRPLNMRDNRRRSA